jgi:hypothetical protein
MPEDHAARQIVIDIYTLVSLAEARGEAKGRAEGVERGAAKIVHCGKCKFGKPRGDGGYWRACELFNNAILEQSAFCSLGELPASVLATKETP